MVSFTTAATVSLVAFASLIEPSIQAAAALRIGAQVVGGALASGGSNNKQNKRATTAAEPAVGAADGTGAFAQCISDVHASGKTRLFLHKETHDAVMTPMPPSCIEAANNVNGMKNIAQIEATQGKIEVVGKDTFKLTGVTGQVQELLEKAAKKGTGKPAGAATGASQAQGGAAPKGGAVPSGAPVPKTN